MKQKRILIVMILAMLMLSALMLAACNADSKEYTISFDLNGGTFVQGGGALDGQFIAILNGSL